MKMKYHKIRNVSPDVCTAEQKIAYNIAFAAHISFGDQYNQARKISAVCGSDALQQILDFEFGKWIRDYGGKYNDDAIWCSLHAGLAEYLAHPFIASDYKTVGIAFPALYR